MASNIPVYHLTFDDIQKLVRVGSKLSNFVLTGGGNLGGDFAMMGHLGDSTYTYTFRGHAAEALARLLEQQPSPTFMELGEGDMQQIDAEEEG